jgi:hypothetical protein
MNESTIGTKAYEISNKLGLLSSYIGEYDGQVKRYQKLEADAKRLFEETGDSNHQITAYNYETHKEEACLRRDAALIKWNSIISKATLQLKEHE